MGKQIGKLWVIILSIMTCACTEKEPEIIHVSSILLNPTSISITEGQTSTISATISPSNASNQKVVWSSSDASVATVNDGVVSAIKSGTATITAKAEDKIATCDISVCPATGAITLDATHITCRSAELSGKVNFSQGSTDMVFGILYSTSSGVLYGKSENLEATVFDSDYNFTLPTEVLEPETTYYYRSYLSQNGEILYGEVKSFTTLPVSSLIQTRDATDIHTQKATLLATLDLTDCRFNVLKYGFEVASEGSPYEVRKAGDFLDNEFSFLLDDLTDDTYYVYRAYVILDEKTYYGKEMTFLTSSIKASIITNNTTDVKCKSAMISGKLTIDSDGKFSKSAKIYFSNLYNTVDELKARGTEKQLILQDDGSFNDRITGFMSNSVNYFVVVAKVEDAEFTSTISSFKTEDVPKNAVDLGLSVLWANSNIGAYSYDDDGDSFSWGEITRGSSIYKWGSYNKYSGEWGSITKYCTSSKYGIVDNKTILDIEDDVAHIRMGDNWRIPTVEEWKELISRCTWDYVYINNDPLKFAGYKIHSKVPGFEENWIFLPVNGYVEWIDSQSAYMYHPDACYYWSSSLVSSGSYSSTDAYKLTGHSGGPKIIRHTRCYGLGVRPVSE